ncbi:hypothetical protein GCM10022210_23830 [Mucilaginibacter dorajii]|uniref:Aspartyl protease n=2 Tax=Mucilaginibacter dorajii TaxID=692994 RepID=A0ABP7PY21_9SPHI
MIWLTTATGATAQINLPRQDQQIKFTWLSDTLNHKPEAYSAMLVSVKLAGCPKAFYMQFDLGAPHSMLYSQQIKNIIGKYPKTDTGTFNIAKGAGKNAVIIGTIGEDMIDGKTLIIDYPKQELSIVTTLPEKLSKQTTLGSFMLMKGSILLPAILNGKQTILFFDTGSSAFELLTSKETADKLAAPNTTTESYPVKSWGRTLTANTTHTQDSLGIAVQKLPIKNVTYIDGASDSQVQQMLKLGIGGMVGNKLFLNTILILDTRNKKFGLVIK